MVMEILSLSGDSVLFARYTGGGGFCPRQQKEWGILSGGGGGDFVLHSQVKHNLSFSGVLFGFAIDQIQSRACEKIP